MLAESITVNHRRLGEGTNQDLLRMIADTGGGRFHAVPDPNSLPKIFTRETELIAQQAAGRGVVPVEQVGAADFLNGIAISSAPLLHGYVSTQMKPAPAQLLLQSDRGDPILARWRAGLGWPWPGRATLKTTGRSTGSAGRVSRSFGGSSCASTCASSAATSST